MAHFSGFKLGTRTYNLSLLNSYLSPIPQALRFHDSTRLINSGLVAFDVRKMKLIVLRFHCLDVVIPLILKFYPLLYDSSVTKFGFL